MAKTTRTATTAGKNMMVHDEETLLKDLFVDELKDIYWAEKYLTKAMPKMKRAASSKELISAIEQHLLQTEGQITRLEQVFELMEINPRAKKCEAMEGLVKEMQNMIEEMPKGSAARDAGLIICAQKIEHYEIASYGSLVQLAKTMGQNEAAELLQETLDEEKQTDLLLTELAISGININAEREEA